MDLLTTVFPHSTALNETCAFIHNLGRQQDKSVVLFLCLQQAKNHQQLFGSCVMQAFGFPRPASLEFRKPESECALHSAPHKTLAAFLGDYEALKIFLNNSLQNFLQFHNRFLNCSRLPSADGCAQPSFNPVKLAPCPPPVCPGCCGAGPMHTRKLECSVPSWRDPRCKAGRSLEIFD